MRWQGRTQPAHNICRQRGAQVQRSQRTTTDTSPRAPAQRRPRPRVGPTRKHVGRSSRAMRRQASALTVHDRVLHEPILEAAHADARHPHQHRVTRSRDRHPAWPVSPRGRPQAPLQTMTLLRRCDCAAGSRSHGQQPTVHHAKGLETLKIFATREDEPGLRGADLHLLSTANLQCAVSAGEAATLLATRAVATMPATYLVPA